MGEEKPRGGCKGCLVTTAIFAAVPLLLVVAYVAWGLWANARAERLATGFCAQVRLGDDEARLKEMAAEASPGNQFPTDDGHRFVWYGMVFHARECRVKLVAGKVAGKQIVRFDD